MEYKVRGCTGILGRVLCKTVVYVPVYEFYIEIRPLNMNGLQAWVRGIAFSPWSMLAPATYRFIQYLIYIRPNDGVPTGYTGINMKLSLKYR